MTESLTRCSVLAAMLFCLGGCGLKGNLYIPEREPANQPQSEQPSPPDADEEQNDNETTGS
ncbi:MAG: hypothetical protein KJO76_01460 [Gammaproteobacteria bacterium]|nr:hypothetical protein [Gammaproteobacteria bacterium]NND37758.1 hypothetical protein [Gammaproteobacteria bacterium]